MDSEGNAPLLAAITVDARGGGVAQVSRLVREVLRRRWSSRAGLLTLIADGGDGAVLQAGLPARLAFGARLAWAQAGGSAPWVFFTHMGIARAQSFVPPPIRRPYAVFLHGIEAWRPLSASQRRVLRNAALRVANSEFTARRATEMLGDVGEICVCPLALPPRHAGSPSGRPDRESQGCDVLVVGRMETGERYKGHDQLLDAWPSVVSLVPAARLVVVGEGSDLPRLRARATALGLDRQVVFKGFVGSADLAAAYASASVFAMPSRGEGFGLVYLEAMSQGLPCIGSIHDAASEIIEDGVTGFLVDQSDIGAVAARIVQLLATPALRARMSAAAIEQARERFGFDRFSNRLQTLIDERMTPLAQSRR